MRKLLYAAVSAVLLPTASFAAPPNNSAKKARTEAPAKSADAKGTADAKTADAKGAADTKAAADKAEGAPAIPAGWTLVTSPEGRFRVAFPVKPEMENSTEDTDAGQAQTITYSVSAADDSSYLAVAVSKFPDGTLSKAIPSEVLEGARDGALANVNGKLVSDKTVMVDAPKGSGRRFFPARDYEATAPQGLRISTRIILVDDRLYQVMLVHKDENTEVFKQLVSTFVLQ